MMTPGQTLILLALLFSGCASLPATPCEKSSQRQDCPSWLARHCNGAGQVVTVSPCVLPYSVGDEAI